MSERSELWNYFMKSQNKKASCNVCKAEISYKSTISNLKNHLKRKHIGVYNELDIKTPKIRNSSTSQNESVCKDFCLETINENVKVECAASQNESVSKDFFLEAINENLKVEFAASTSTSFLSSTLSSSSSSTIPHTSCSQPPNKIGPYLQRKITLDRKKSIDRDLMDLFIKDLQPFSIVEDVGFSKLMKWIPEYELPGRKTISSEMIPALYRKTLRTLKEVVLLEAESICLTTDCWTSSTNESNVALTGHYITQNFEFKSILIRCCNFTGRYTAIDLSKSIKDAMVDWDLQNKVNFCVSNNANDVTNAIENHLKYEHYGCYAHQLNLIVRKSLHELDPTTEKIKKIVGYFKRSTTATEKFLKYQISSGRSVAKRLIQDVSTRWNSTFYMLQRFVELEETIKAATALIDEELPVISTEEWQTCRYVCEILSPFEEMTNSMSGEKYMTGSSAIVITRCLKGVCAKFKQRDYPPIAKAILKALEKGLQAGFEQIEANNTLTLCTLLDPRFKDRVFENNIALKDAKAKLLKLVENLIEKKNQPMTQVPSGPASKCPDPSTSTMSAWYVFDDILMANKRPQTNSLSKATKEIDSYLKDDILPRQKNELGENSCPYNWWKQHQYVYPNLAELFRTRCNIVATSVPYERLFSKAGTILNERRTRLSSTTVEMLIFLNGNSNFMRK